MVGAFAAAPILDNLGFPSVIPTVILMLIGLGLCSCLTQNENKNEHMRLLTEKEAELNNFQQEYDELIKNKAGNTVLYTIIRQ